MYKDERDVFYYDIVSRAWNRKYGQALQPIPHYELAKVIKRAFDDGTAEQTRKTTKQSTYITAIRVMPDRCEMLVGFSDPVAADPTFHDRPAKSRRVVRKEGEEGLEHSAHLIWHYKTKDNVEKCPFYLEGAIGLSSTAIVRFFNHLFRLHSTANKDYFTAPDPEGVTNADGTYKRLSVRPRIELLGHPSKEFIRDLQHGTLSEVELYTESERETPWDGHAYGVEERRSVFIRPNKAKHVPNAKAMLDGILRKKVKDEFEYARVVFKTEGNVTRNVKMYSQNYNLVRDDTYVKKDRIKELGGNLPNAFAAFHPEILRRMRLIAHIK